jgi:hypothetical protein
VEGFFPIALGQDIKYWLYQQFKAILQVLSNPPVLALLETDILLFDSKHNNKVLRDLIIPEISP